MAARMTTGGSRRKRAATAAKPSTSRHPPRPLPPRSARVRAAVSQAYDRVRALCLSHPGVYEKEAWAAATFRVEGGKMFLMFADNHHEDGHLAVWLPAPAGLQSALIGDAPATYFKPPYVGSSGWIGIELDQIRDEALEIHVREAWQLAASKKKKARQRS